MAKSAKLLNSIIYLKHWGFKDVYDHWFLRHKNQQQRKINQITQRKKPFLNMLKKGIIFEISRHVSE